LLCSTGFSSTMLPTAPVTAFLYLSLVTHGTFLLSSPSFHCSKYNSYLDQEYLLFSLLLLVHYGFLYRHISQASSLRVPHPTYSLFHACCLTWSLTLKMEVVNYSGRWVKFYQSTHSHITEDSSLHSLCYENLKLKTSASSSWLIQMPLFQILQEL
jgi:hypothetical protein